MRVYSNSNAVPCASTSRVQEYCSGMIRSAPNFRVARSCAIFRNNRYVSCSVYSSTPTPSSRRTSQ